MTWLSAVGNLLPVDRSTGGQARFVGWVDLTGTTVNGTGGAITVARNAGIRTVDSSSGVAVNRIPIEAGEPYIAAADANDFGVIALLWIGDDGVVVPGPVGVGAGRITATGTPPPGIAGVAVELLAPQATYVDNGDGTLTVTYAPEADFGGYFAADATPSSSPVTFTNPVLTVGGIDPGALNPSLVDDSVGTQIYRSLPAFMRDADTNQHLWAYVKGIGEPGDEIADVITQVSSGVLTDPVNAPDAWIPWLAQAAGAATGSVDDMRAALLAKQNAPQLGTRDHIAATAQRFLSGSKLAQVLPGTASQWQIVVRVRTDELGNVGGSVSNLAAALMGTGLMPAGHYITVIAGSPSWTSIDAAFTTWDSADNYGDGSWNAVDAIGVT